MLSLSPAAIVYLNTNLLFVTAAPANVIVVEPPLNNAFVKVNTSAAL